MERTHGGDGETAVEKIVKITRGVVTSPHDTLKAINNKHCEIMERLIACCHPQLFIFVEPVESKSEEKKYSRIYVYDTREINRENIEQHVMECLIGSATINKSDIRDIKEELRGYLKQNNERKIINLGKNLYNKYLFPPTINKTKLKGALQNDSNKIKEVLIYCEDEDIDYAWEWICWKKKLLRSNFFWGDQFQIVRIPKDGIPHRELKNSNFQIKKFAAVLDPGCKCTKGDINYFTELLGEKNYKKIKVQELSPTNLNAIDCIHFVANIETFIKQPVLFRVCDTICDTTLKGQNTSNSNGANKQLKFLFLNIRVPTPEDNASRLSKLKESFTRAAEIYIDTTFDPPDDSEICFVKSFYDEFQKQKNVVEAATEARKSIGSKKLWRLAYVIKGNPCTVVTWKVALGTQEQKK